eukprot:COSAG01_NODE_5925_length_3948_cov_37.584631_3_plen_530_part_00
MATEAPACADDPDAYFWIGTGPNPCVDVHAAFRGSFTVHTPTTVHIDHVAVSWYNLFIDGKRRAEGPTRFVAEVPYFARTTCTLGSGTHVIAIHAHSAGEQTRTMLKRPAAVFCRATTEQGTPLHISWACTPLTLSTPHGPNGGLGLYKSQWNRISVLLGWAECCTVNAAYGSWTQPGFDGSSWKPVKLLPAPISYSTPVPLDSVAAPASSVAGASLQALAHGQLWERYGYVDDNPPARAFLRKLVAAATDDDDFVPMAPPAPADDYGPAQGKWWRFDLGKCRLTRLELTVNMPAGTVVEISYAQELLDGEQTGRPLQRTKPPCSADKRIPPARSLWTGRVSPWMTLCGSTSCYLDRYTIGGDVSSKEVRFCPLEPRGCRYIEVHALCETAPIQPDPVASLAAIKLISAVPLNRGYAPMQLGPAGGWSCAHDPLLTRIWAIGIETTRSCTEDTPIDGPCRERGMWTGDTLAVTLQNVAACYSDTRALKLCLIQASSAEGVNANGMISGNCPENTYLLDYVCIWFTGTME